LDNRFARGELFKAEKAKRLTLRTRTG